MFCALYALFLLFPFLKSTKQRVRFTIIASSLSLIFFLVSGGVPSISYLPDLDETSFCPSNLVAQKMKIDLR